MNNVRAFIPILDWLPKYKKSYLRGDLLAGLTVGVMLVPQGMAYGLLAGLPPVRIALTPAGPSDVTLAPGEVLTPISADERARHLDDDAR